MDPNKELVPDPDPQIDADPDADLDPTLESGHFPGYDSQRGFETGRSSRFSPEVVLRSVI